MNIGYIILGLTIFVASVALMGYTQSHYSTCPQFGQIISKEVPPTSDPNCVIFNLVEVLLIVGAFVGTVVGIIGLLAHRKNR